MERKPDRSSSQLSVFSVFCRILSCFMRIWIVLHELTDRTRDQLVLHVEQRHIVSTVLVSMAKALIHLDMLLQHKRNEICRHSHSCTGRTMHFCGLSLYVHRRSPCTQRQVGEWCFTFYNPHLAYIWLWHLTTRKRETIASKDDMAWSVAAEPLEHDLDAHLSHTLSLDHAPAYTASMRCQHAVFELSRMYPRRTSSSPTCSGCKSIHTIHRPLPLSFSEIVSEGDYRSYEATTIDEPHLSSAYDMIVGSWPRCRSQKFPGSQTTGPSRLVSHHIFGEVYS